MKNEIFDVVVIGAGLSGLVVTYELSRHGKRVLLLDQESEQNLGGQAFWSFGGLFFVDSPEQRRMGIRDSYDLALQDWMDTAGFDRSEDHWPRQWAQSYVEFAAGRKRDWLTSLGMKFFPVVGWAERGGHSANGPGNSVPRFHVTWGTGPGVLEPFEARVREAAKAGLVRFGFRHRVTEFLLKAGRVVGVAGEKLVESRLSRGQATSREVVDLFRYESDAVVVASGGIGGNLDLVRENWPPRLGRAPQNPVVGVPAYVDGLLLGRAEAVGGSLINRDRMWHYCEGLKNWNPIWPQHGIRILPGPSSVWFDAEGNRFPHPYSPGFDTLGTLDQIMKTGYSYSWFVLSQKIIEKEFALSGSEQNPDLTERSLLKLAQRLLPGAPGPVEAFKTHGEDFVVRDNLTDLVAGMNELVGTDLLEVSKIEATLRARDSQVGQAFCKDSQIAALTMARTYLGDRLLRVAKPHAILDPRNGPLIAVRLNILTRKTLGGLHTNLQSQVLDRSGNPIEGFYAVGEAAGFGGGGMHGYRALEGTFLGGCLYSGLQAGRALAATL